MRPLALAILLLVCASRVEAAHVHTEQNSTLSSGSTLAISSYSSSAGNLILCSTMGFQTSGPPSVTGISTGSQSFTLFQRYPTTGSEDNDKTEVWYLANASGGTITITATWASSFEYKRLICSEFSGQATSSPVDGSGAATGGDSSSASTGSYSAAGSSLWYCAAASPNTSTWSVGGSWTIPTNGSGTDNMPGAVAYYDSPGSSPQTCTFTIDSGQWRIVGGAFLDPAAASGSRLGLLGVGR